MVGASDDEALEAKTEALVEMLLGGAADDRKTDTRTDGAVGEKALSSTERSRRARAKAKKKKGQSGRLMPGKDRGAADALRSTSREARARAAARRTAYLALESLLAITATSQIRVQDVRDWQQAVIRLRDTEPDAPTV